MRLTRLSARALTRPVTTCSFVFRLNQAEESKPQRGQGVRPCTQIWSRIEPVTALRNIVAAGTEARAWQFPIPEPSTRLAPERT